MTALADIAISVFVVLVLLLGLRVPRPGTLPAQTGIGRKGQLTKFNKRRPQQHRTRYKRNNTCNNEPDHRLDPRGAVDQEPTLLFKHAHNKQQLEQTNATTYYQHYHRHKRRKRKLLPLLLLAVALTASRYVPLETVSNDPYRSMTQTEDLQVYSGDNTAHTLFPNATEALCSVVEQNNMSHPCTADLLWHWSIQQPPPYRLDGKIAPLSAQVNCCNRHLARMRNSLHSQGAHHCLATKCTQCLHICDDQDTLLRTIDKLMSADSLPTDVSQMLNHTGTIDPNKSGA